MGRTGPIAFFVAVALALAVATGSDALISTHAAKQEAVVARVARMLDIEPWALTSQSLTGLSRRTRSRARRWVERSS